METSKFMDPTDRSHPIRHYYMMHAFVCHDACICVVMPPTPSCTSVDSNVTNSIIEVSRAQWESQLFVDRGGGCARHRGCARHLCAAHVCFIHVCTHALYTCVHLYTLACDHLHTCIHIHIHTYTRTHIYLCTGSQDEDVDSGGMMCNTFMRCRCMFYTHMYIHIRMNIDICTHMYTYVHIHAHIYISAQGQELKLL